MAKALQQTAAPLPTPEAPQVTEAQAAFDAALAALARAAFVHNEARDGVKEAAPAVRDATRAAGWAAFDLVESMNDPEAASAKGETLALLIATARGVTEKARPVYAQRGRALYAHRANIQHAGRVRENKKGEKVNGREKADPFTIVKGLLASAAIAKARREDDGPHMAEAEALAAQALEITQGELKALAISATRAGQDAREAIAAALADVKEAKGAEAAFLRTLATLQGAPDDVKARCIEAFNAAFPAKVQPEAETD